eukprot:gnl/TRDRNA2_/TRDRNA2_153261_c1_seq2.p1 gnl/TRDRNA2_/TRDRNA2_153261_c1~~gnl/TRDRNA2_/TRDRNA2_153261_c1_seq2.p1  ORF type:complete len:364 (-),score=40.93 gnl/TRDRNA2_/TRDRNA2_153261_c1_seq2:34-1029(-)
MAESVKHIALQNRLAGLDPSDIKLALGESSVNYSIGGQILHTFQPAADDKYPPPPSGASGLKSWYWMDLASLLPAIALKPEKGQSILDLCAAPGGKSFVIAQQLFQGTDSTGEGTLTCNEIDKDRRIRLSKVIKEYIPTAVRSQVRLTPFDGTKRYKMRENSFDGVLVDALCSSERHWVEKAIAKRRQVDKSEWSPSRCKRYAKTQLGLLRTALFAVREGGRIVYSTCSIAPVENDAVVSKILKKFSAEVRVIDAFADDHTALTQLGAEKTKHGWIMLPDKSRSGPIYWAVLEKLVTSDHSGSDSGTDDEAGEPDEGSDTASDNTRVTPQH